MGVYVVPHGTYQDDFGDQQKLYPIPPKQDLREICYSKQIQRTAYVQANVVACFNEWFLSFFEPNYFKFTRIRTQSSYADFKSFMKQIYKKEKPFLVIDPREIEHVEDSIFGQNMINRYNLIDPDHDNIGAKLLYSIDIMKSDKFQLAYRRNRFRFEFDIMIMEQTLDRQIDTYNMMLMNIRHNSKFLLRRTVPHLLPLRYITAIANLHGYDWKTDTFLDFLNSISEYPIIRRITPNGQYMFFMQQEISLQMEVPGLPAKDTPENSNAIEWGARITDSFIIMADLPTEFLFLIPTEFVSKIDTHIPEDPENIYYISPVYADMDWPKEINGYTLTKRVDVMMQDGDDPHLDLKGVLENENIEIFKTLKECIDKHGKLSDLVLIKVYPNGSMEEAKFTFNEDGILTMINPIPNKIYTVNIYLNYRNLNLIRSGKTTEYIGTIEKY